MFCFLVCFLKSIVCIWFIKFYNTKKPFEYYFFILSLFFNKYIYVYMCVLSVSINFMQSSAIKDLSEFCSAKLKFLDHGYYTTIGCRC